MIFASTTHFESVIAYVYMFSPKIIKQQYKTAAKIPTVFKLMKCQANELPSWFVRTQESFYIYIYVYIINKNSISLCIHIYEYYIRYVSLFLLLGDSMALQGVWRWQFIYQDFLIILLFCLPCCGIENMA